MHVEKFSGFFEIDVDRLFDSGMIHPNKQTTPRCEMKKSRYQMTNRGRKGKPCWYVEDFKDVGGSIGKYLYSSNLKYAAEDFLSNLREYERKQFSND